MAIGTFLIGLLAGSVYYAIARWAVKASGYQSPKGGTIPGESPRVIVFMLGVSLVIISFAVALDSAVFLHIGAAMVSIYCLTLRRVRSEVRRNLQ